MGQVKVLHEPGTLPRSVSHTIVVRDPMTDSRKVLVLTDAEYLQLRVQVLADAKTLPPVSTAHTGHDLGECLRRNLAACMVEAIETNAVGREL